MKFNLKQAWNRWKGSSEDIIDASLPNLVWPYQQIKIDRRAATFDGLVDRYASWVYLCASRNANAIAQVPLELFSTSKGAGGKKVGKKQFLDLETRAWFAQKGYNPEDVEIVKDHPFLDLMEKANPFENGFELLEKLVLYLELTGNAYWYTVDTLGGIPTEIWVMPSQWVRIVADKKTFVSHYLYGPTTEASRVRFEPEEVIHFRYPNPRDLFYGLSPLEAALDAVDTSTSYARYESNLLQNNARPDIMLSTDAGKVSKEDVRRIKADWNTAYRGTANAGKLAVLTGGLKPVPLNFKPAEMSYLMGRESTRDEIAAIFGIPKSMITTNDVNRANAASGEYTYAKYTLLPKLRRIEQKLNEKLVSRFGGQYFCAFKNPVPEDQEFRLKELETKISIGYSTINEQRAIDNLEPVEWGDEPSYEPPSVVAEREVELAEETARINAVNRPKPPAAKAQDEVQKKVPTFVPGPRRMIQFAEDDGTVKTVWTAKSALSEELAVDMDEAVDGWEFKHAVIKAADESLWPSPVPKLSKLLAPQIQTYWDFLSSKIPDDWVAVLYSQNVEQYGNRPEGKANDPLVNIILAAVDQFLSGDAEALEDVLVPKLAAARAEGLNLETRRAMREFNIGSAQFTKPADPAAIAWAEEYAARQVVEIAESTRLGIAEAIADGIRNMRGVEGTARDLRDQIGLNSARLRTVENYRAQLERRGLDRADVAGKVERFARKQLRQRSELIANNEINVAVSTAQLDRAQRLGREEKEYLTVGDDRVSEDICLPNESEGRVPIDYIYVHGGLATPGHVRCRCAVSYFGGTRDVARAALLAP